MQLKAKLVQVLPLQTGESKNGPWKKQEIILETDSQYPKKVCVGIWGDKINDAQLQLGNILDVQFEVESREYNGRWYTDCKAWKIDISGTVPAHASGTESLAPTTNFDAVNSQPIAEDDLPF